LLDAIGVLDDLAAGRVPDRARLHSGASALETLRRAGIANRDLVDAAASLEAMANRRTLKLRAAGRARAAAIAAAIRGFMQLG